MLYNGHKIPFLGDSTVEQIIAKIIKKDDHFFVEITKKTFLNNKGKPVSDGRRKKKFRWRKITQIEAKKRSSIINFKKRFYCFRIINNIKTK
jgi:hypothetical protein